MEEVDKSIHWRAIYKSGEILEQLESTEEILYENIDQENLKEFYLIGYPIELGINLEKGTIKINQSEVCFNGISNINTNYRLIYYIKSSGVLGSSRQNKIYCIGLQTTYDKINRKVVVELFKNKIIIKIEVN